jgi:hypothetical protein
MLYLQNDQSKTEPKLWSTCKKQNCNKSIIRYDKTMFSQFQVFIGLRNFRNQIPLICLLSILNIYQPKHWFCFILVTLYNLLFVK